MAETRKRILDKGLESILEGHIEERLEAAAGIEAEVGRRIESKIEQKKKQKRSALLDSAYELFSTEGFSSTTIRDITRNAGVAKGTFYLYYNDKDAILRDLMRIHAARLLTGACAHLDEMRDKNSQVSIADKFIYIVDYIVDHVVADSSLLRLIAKNLSWGLFNPSEKENPVGTDAGDSDFDFEAYIASMLEADGVRLREPRLLIFTILQMVASTCYDALMYEQPVSLEEYKPYLNNCIRLLVEAAIIT